ncbi:MAG: hypothetical protein RR367_09160, partial [Clostridia bacterium]
ILPYYALFVICFVRDCPDFFRHAVSKGNELCYTMLCKKHTEFERMSEDEQGKTRADHFGRQSHDE